MAPWSLEHVVVPGATAAVAGLLSALLLADPWVSAASAAVGAMAGALLAARPEDARPPAEPHTMPTPVAPKVPIDPRFSPGMGRMLIEHLPMGIIMVNEEGTVQFINPVAREWFGSHRTDGFHMSAFRTPKLLDAIETTLTDGLRATVHFTLSRAKDTYLRAHVLPLTNMLRGRGSAGNIAVLAVIEDHTQAHRAEELHRDFVANASHELKTPLSSISVIVETLNGHAKNDPAAAARFLEILEQQTDRMRQLIEDLISLNRIELNERLHPSDPQPIKRIVCETAEALRPLAEAASMQFSIIAPSDRPLVAGNRDELVQVFINLIENAVRYGKPGKEVRVMYLEDPQRHAGHVGIAVEDDGPGIPREHLPRLTERFYRVSAPRSRESGGTGLGLAIVKHILNRHRGVLEIESVVGRGSRFTVWLPVLKGTEAPVDLGPTQKRKVETAG
ncbi:MAG: ATP-binding protein [Pseudomonadota bacterium]